MTSFTIIPSTNVQITPSWITSERYLYCDRFVEDYAGKGKETLIDRLQKIFGR